MAQVTWHTVGDDEWDGYAWIPSGLAIGLLSGSRSDLFVSSPNNPRVRFGGVPIMRETTIQVPDHLSIQAANDPLVTGF